MAELAVSTSSHQFREEAEVVGMTMQSQSDFVRKSYRYLRLGLIGSTAMLGISILIEWNAVGYDCFQTSVSGYYFTPVRAVFVSVLVTIGLALIVIKGQDREDLWLNFAGMLAPVVAFVPTQNVDTCWSSPPPASPMTTAPDGSTVLAEWVLANVGNNLRSLFIVGLVGVVVAAVILVVGESDPAAVLKLNQGDQAARRGMAATLIVIVIIWVLYEQDLEWFQSQIHNVAAISMFFFLALASIESAVRVRTTRPLYFRWYAAIAASMAATAGLVLLFGKLVDPWDHQVFVLEAVEVFLFATYWIVQTFEHWNEAPFDEEPTRASTSEAAE